MAELICSRIPFPVMNSPAPRSPQKTHPPVPHVPSRFGQVKPPSTHTLYDFEPKISLKHVLTSRKGFLSCGGGTPGPYLRLRILAISKIKI
ncbi:MAG: hypothetical protein Q4D17_02550 [Planctomycetia bacterium]|nr:hypothetical protein [Planctomycetia bacterium]